MGVFAAASLREAFEEIAQSSGGGERFNFAGSQVLRLQLDQGARADVFASADARQMTLARQAGLVGEGVVFARNTLVVVTPASGSRPIESVADLARPGLRIVLAASQVPAGAYSREALARLAVELGLRAPGAILANVVSEEEDVRRVLTKVRLGEADAGVVYASDVVGAGGEGVRWFPFAPAMQPDIAYYIAPVRGGDAKAAQKFIDLVLSPAGQRALEKRGFSSPS